MNIMTKPKERSLNYHVGIAMLLRLYNNDINTFNENYNEYRYYCFSFKYIEKSKDDYIKAYRYMMDILYPYKRRGRTYITRETHIAIVQGLHYLTGMNYEDAIDGYEEMCLEYHIKYMARSSLLKWCSEDDT